MSENMDMKIKFSVGAREVILSVMLVLMIYFAVNNPVYGWFNFLMSTAIVVGAGSMILLVYESSKGNVFELPKIDWKDALWNVLMICLTIGLFIIGMFVLLVGISSFMSVILKYDPFVYSWFITGIGFIAIVYAYILFNRIFRNDEEDG